MSLNSKPDQNTTPHLDVFKQHIEERGLPIFRGLEKEGLRAQADTFISQSDHPTSLGHPLTHPSITTDYSEALLELITDVEPSREALLNSMEEIHRFVQKNIGDEVLWAGSMPCKLDGESSIRIAEYGDSNIGRLKYVYREGLGVRYGRIMQSIAGLHFNFSYDDRFWERLRATLGLKNQSLQDFKSEQYFHLIRNFRRYSWLLMYLFGASPCLDKSFLDGKNHKLEQFDDKGTLFLPYATSLRMGDLGYHNNAQSSLAICFNRLENFIHTLGQAINTSYKPYEEIGIKKDGRYVQINTNILQIENEYYSSIRPKRSAKSGETPRHALSERGVEYIEVRCLDLNPFLATGISDTQIDFMDIFLSFCLSKASPVINDDECRSLDDNFNLVVNRGREPGLKLNHSGTQVTLKDWGQSLLQEMQGVAEILDQANQDRRYSKALQEQLNKILEPELTPSAHLLSVMRQENLSWIELANELSLKHKATLTNSHKNSMQALDLLAKDSITKADEIKQGDTQSFDDFIIAYQAD